MSLSATSVHAVEVLDSRGRPTLEVEVTLAGGAHGWAGVPSGASTGSGEAVELRDGDQTRFGGRGVAHAVANVDRGIADAICGREFADLAELDAAMIAADGSPDKARFGANAIVGVSMAVARAEATRRGTPLWQYLQPDGVVPRLPVPHFNVVNGGAHAANELDFQEFMIAPLGASTMADAVRAGSEIYSELRAVLADRGHHTGLGDEGGFAPQLARPDAVLQLLVCAIEDAGYSIGRDGIMLALDPATSGFHSRGRYSVAGERLSSEELVSYYEKLVADFPIWSIEDGMAEDDHVGWRLLTERLGERIQLVGDDNFVTDPRRIERAAAHGIANAALIKLNQIGTVSETLAALAVCREADYAAMISHRSGETTDPFIADLAVGCGCGQLKSGAPARGERVAKYNRLLMIADRHASLPYGLPKH